MATQLFLGAADSTEAGFTIASHRSFKLLTVQTGTNTTFTTAMSVAGNHIESDDEFGTGSANKAIWVYQVNPVTISSTITMNFFSLESAMTTNIGMAVLIQRYSSAGTFISDVIAQANAAHAKGVEMGTALATQNWTATPTSTTFSAGDWLAVILHYDSVGGMAAGNGGTNFGQPSPSDSYVSFVDTIPAYVPAAANPPYRNPMPPLIAQ